MGIVLILLTLGLAFANGENDVSKGIVTLVGSGATRYRAAVTWGTACTPKILALGIAATAGYGISAFGSTRSSPRRWVSAASSAAFA